MYQFSEGFCYVAAGLGGIVMALYFLLDYLELRENRDKEVKKMRTIFGAQRRL